MRRVRRVQGAGEGRGSTAKEATRRESGAVGAGLLRHARVVTLLLVGLFPVIVFGLLLLPAPRDALLPLIHPRATDWGRAKDREALDRRQPFIDRGPGSSIQEPLMARLRPRSEGSRWVHELPLRIEVPTNAVRPRALAFHFVQPTRPVSFRRAELVTPTGSVVSTRADFERFEIRPRFIEHVVEFPWPLASVGTSGQVWTLRVVTDEPDELWLWTRGLTASEAEVETGWLALADRPLVERLPESINGWIPLTQARSNALHTLLVEGHVLMDSPIPAVSRLRVLSWVWGFRTPSGLGRLVGLACILVVGGVVLWPRARIVPGFPARVGVSLGGGFLGLAVLYALFAPPFQAPDEPEHLISFAKGNGRTNLVSSGRTVATRAHLERIAFRPDQKLRPDHLHSESGGWSDSVETAPSRPERSGLVFRYWQGLSGLTAWIDPADMLLWIRLANAIVAAVCLGFAAAMLARAEPNPRVGRSAGALWLTIPTLPFFTVFVSNYSIYLAASVLAAGTLVATVLGNRPDPLRGFLMGLSMGFLLHVSRGAIPLIVSMALILLIDAVLPAGEVLGRSGSRLWERLAMVAGFVPSRWLTTPEYDHRMASELTALVPGLGVGALGMLYLSAVGVGAAVLVVADGLGGAVSRELRGQERAQRLASVRASGWGWFGPVFLGVVVFLSILPVPETPVLEFGHPVSGVGYALHCLAAWFTSFGPTRQDFATSRTFWSGFGWLEFSLPRVLIVGPGLLWVVGWILGLAVEGAATRRTVTRVRAVAFGLALVLGLLGVFIAAHQAGYSVRGRYLFPLNMLVCAFAGVWLARGLVARLPALRGCDVFAVFGPVILIHAATLGVLLARYF